MRKKAYGIVGVIATVGVLLSGCNGREYTNEAYSIEVANTPETGKVEYKEVLKDNVGVLLAQEEIPRSVTSSTLKGKSEPYKYTASEKVMSQEVLFDYSTMLSKRGMDFIRLSQVLTDYTQSITIPLVKKGNTLELEDYIHRIDNNTLQDFEDRIGVLHKIYGKVIEPYKKGEKTYYMETNEKTYSNLYRKDTEVIENLYKTSGSILEEIKLLKEYRGNEKNLVAESTLEGEEELSKIVNKIRVTLSDMDNLSEHVSTSYFSTIYGYDMYEMKEYVAYKNLFYGEEELELLQQADKISEKVLNSSTSKDINWHKVADSKARIDGIIGTTTLSEDVINNFGLIGVLEELTGSDKVNRGTEEERYKALKRGVQKYLSERDKYYNNYTYYGVPKKDKGIVMGYTRLLNSSNYLEEDMINLK